MIADYWCGILDENGNGRVRGALDGLFGIERAENETYFGEGDQIWEIDGERYRQPYLERLDYENALRHEGIVRPERAREALLESRHGSGRAVYLNLSPLAYFDHEIRLGKEGEPWRSIVAKQFQESGLHPEISASAISGGAPFVPVEVIQLDLRNGRRFVGVVMNPSRQGSIDSIGDIGRTVSGHVSLRLENRRGWREAVNLRTGEKISDGPAVEFSWDPFEMIVIECDR